MSDKSLVSVKVFLHVFVEKSLSGISIPTDVIGVVTLGIDTIKTMPDVSVVPHSYSVMKSGFLVGVHLCTTQALCVSSMDGVLQTHSCARCVGSRQSSDELFLCLYPRTAFCHPSF